MSLKSVGVSTLRTQIMTPMAGNASAIPPWMGPITNQVIRAASPKAPIAAYVKDLMDRTRRGST